MAQILVTCWPNALPIKLQVTEPLELALDTLLNSNNTWKIYMDGSSILEGSRAGVVIISLKGIIIEHGLHLKFPATNNEAEYEALIAELGIDKEIGM